MKQVLVLEDNPELLRLYGKVLSKLGCHVDLVTELCAAERALECRRYDLFICDMQIEEKSSLGLLEAHIKALHDARTRVVVISGQMRYLSACEALKVDRFIIKPIMSDMLRGIVQELITPAEYKSLAD